LSIRSTGIGFHQAEGQPFEQHQNQDHYH
jgi:hypothetical protein